MATHEKVSCFSFRLCYSGRVSILCSILYEGGILKILSEDRLLKKYVNSRSHLLYVFKKICIQATIAQSKIDSDTCKYEYVIKLLELQYDFPTTSKKNIFWVGIRHESTNMIFIFSLMLQIRPFSVRDECRCPRLNILTVF